MGAFIYDKSSSCRFAHFPSLRFGRAEGTVVMVVKLLEDAIRDGDHIYGTVSHFILLACDPARNA